MFEHMLSVYSPKSPADMDWATLYPTYAVEDRRQTKAKSHDGDEEEQSTKTTAITKNVEIADIGCGFGGLTFALAPKFPDTLILGASLRLHRFDTCAVRSATC